jgi:hypothetical protein
VSDNDLVDVVELVPVLVLLVGLAIERLELRTSWDGDVEGLGRVEGLLVEQVELVSVCHVAQELIGEPV